MTPEERSTLRRLSLDAWPAPWEKMGNTISLKVNGLVVMTITLPGDHQTLEFLVAARKALPDLLDQLDAAERRAAMLESQVGTLREAAENALPSAEVLDFYERMLDRNPCGIEPWAIEQWSKMLALRAALDGTMQET